MSSAKGLGRIVGTLLLLHLAGLIVPFVLLLPLTTDPQAWLVDAAGLSARIKVAVFLLFANCALTIGISIAVFGILRHFSEALGLWLVAAGVIMFTLQAVDNVHVLSMLSLSQQYAQGSEPEELLRAIATAVRTTRRWAHVTELLAIDGWILLLYASLYCFALVPRTLAAFGLTTVVLHFAGITLRLFLGHEPVALLGMPMALSHMALAIWLIAQGFDLRSRPPYAISAAWRSGASPSPM